MASVFLQNEAVADKINVGDAEENEDSSKELASRRTIYGYPYQSWESQKTIIINFGGEGQSSVQGYCLSLY